jgi:hypothetical protein
VIDHSKATHAEIVRAENERRRIAKEEADRLAFEKAERKRLKLEMKIRRRENRRLYALERIFTEAYANSADIEKDLINVADLDGSDNNGMKTMGLRGGLLGEIFFQLQHMRRLPQFAQIGSNWPQLPTLLTNFWNSLVGEGWTVMIGEDPLFERNITPVMEGVNLDRLDTEYIKNLSGTDISGVLAYLKAHLRNNSFDARYPGIVERRERLMELLKYEPPADGQEGDKDDNADNVAIEKDLNQPPIPAPEEDPDATPEQIELLKYLDLVLNMIFDENIAFHAVRFVKATPKAPVEEKKDDGGEQAAPIPRVTAVYIPVPPPAEDPNLADQDALKPVETKVADPKLADTDKLDGDGDGNADEPKIVEPELLPFVPQQQDFVGEFESQVSLVDYGKKDLDIACFHVPMAKHIATKLYAAAAQLLGVEGDLSEMVNEAVLAALEDVRAFSKENGRDVLYINSY